MPFRSGQLIAPATIRAGQLWPLRGSFFFASWRHLEALCAVFKAKKEIPVNVYAPPLLERENSYTLTI
jgi:hypothetical protein